MDDERKLVSKVLNGHPGADREFVRRYQRLVHGAIDRFRLSHEQVDDLTQDVWAKLFSDDWGVLRQWRGTGSLEGYLKRIASRVTIDWLRSRRLTVPIDTVDDGDEGQNPRSRWDVNPVATYDEYDAAIELRQLKELLARAAHRISPSCRERIVMRFFGDMDYEHMASVFGTNVESVRVRVSQCVSQLRELLQSRWGLLTSPSQHDAI